MAGNWTKLTATGRTEQRDDIVAVMSMLDNGLMIEDYSDFSLSGMYGELVDESILNADKSTVKVSLFVPEEKNLSEYTSYLNERFSALGISATLTADGMNEEDWAESWKKYYQPIPLAVLCFVVLPCGNYRNLAERDRLIILLPAFCPILLVHSVCRKGCRNSERGKSFVKVGGIFGKVLLLGNEKRNLNR